MTSLRVPRAEHQEQGAAVAATCAHHRGGSRAMSNRFHYRYGAGGYPYAKCSAQGAAAPVAHGSGLKSRRR
jgi:hypothetical protein